MKFKGKIVQIIPEEKAKSFNIKRMPNYDHLNVVELNLWKHQQEPHLQIQSKITGWIVFIGLVLLILELVVDLGFNYRITGIIKTVPWIFIIIPISFALIYNYFWDRKYRKPWYFDFPIPIEKPHNFNLNDEVEINFEVKANENK